MNHRVIIADDHPIFRQGLANVLRNAEGVELVGEAGDGEQALELIERVRPDIAVLDINMPLMDGLNVIRAARVRSLPCSFVVLTMFKDREYFQAAMESGVMGYLLKDSAAVDLLKCLRAVASGKHYITPALSDYLVTMEGSTARGEDPAGLIRQLSPTERRIMRMIAENKTSKEIADELNISFHTVNNHRAHICEKLHLEGPHRLLRFALEHRASL